MQVQTTLVSHETKSGTSQKGPWTRHIFTDAANVKFQTFDQNVANIAYGLLNQPVVVTYEIRQNGSYQNNDITSVAPAGAASVPMAAAAPVAQAAPAAVAPQVSDAERAREIRIMRQSGLRLAIETVAARITGVEDINALFRLSETYVKYFAGGPSAVGAQSQAAPPPPAAGGDAVAPGPAQAPAAAAPAGQAPLTAPNGPDDDIPF